MQRSKYLEQALLAVSALVFVGARSVCQRAIRLKVVCNRSRYSVES